MYLGPLEASKPWNTRDIVGVHRFLRRIWRTLADEEGNATISETPASETSLRALHSTIERVTGDLDRMSFNTAIAALIELLSELAGKGPVPREIAEPFILLLAPFAPHLAEEIWSMMGHQETLAHAPWPIAEERYLKADTLSLSVQVNGKLRGSVTVAADADKATILDTARGDANVARHLEGKTMRREIYVPGRIVNFVVS
jgi:leucyl-tRNA synthetase